jgi:hypothetical protein
LIALFQEWIMFPGHAFQGSASSMVHPVNGAELVHLDTARGDKIVVLFGKSIQADSATRPTIIYFYGNGDNLAAMAPILDDWRMLGVNVLGVEYPGYGMSSGQPGEQAIYAAANTAYDYLVKRGDVDSSKFIAVGRSLGTGVAIDLASRKPIAAMLLISPYTNMKEMARRVAPWMPAGLFLRHHFDNLQKIPRLKMPISVVYGDHDTTIPPQFSQRLAKAATNADVTIAAVESDHNDIFDLGGDGITHALTQLIDRVMAGH